METNDYKGAWISSNMIYYKDPFQEINNLDWVKKEDQEFAKNNLNGYLFGKCIDLDGDYLVLYNNRYKIRILPQLIRKIYPTPKFEWGEQVQEKIRPEINGIIEKIMWHDIDQEYKYYISVNGKSKSRRYNSGELQLIVNLE